MADGRGVEINKYVKTVQMDLTFFFFCFTSLMVTVKACFSQHNYTPTILHQETVIRALSSFSLPKSPSGKGKTMFISFYKNSKFNSYDSIHYKKVKPDVKTT